MKKLVCIEYSHFFSPVSWSVTRNFSVDKLLQVGTEYNTFKNITIIIAVLSTSSFDHTLQQLITRIHSLLPTSFTHLTKTIGLKLYTFYQANGVGRVYEKIENFYRPPLPMSLAIVAQTSKLPAEWNAITYIKLDIKLVLEQFVYVPALAKPPRSFFI